MRAPIQGALYTICNEPLLKCTPFQTLNVRQELVFYFNPFVTFLSVIFSRRYYKCHVGQGTGWV